jgi:hypothetical protein
LPTNYNDERFAQVETDKKEALSELEQTYAGMIGSSDQFYTAQIDASKQWADKQSALQQEQTDFTIEQIEQQKDQAQKDYTKEQSGAYVDWQKQSGAYGANAEGMAAAGLAGSGFSESSQVSMYNTYQNRVAMARETFNKAILTFNNNIKEARLQNNAALAEIYFQAHKEQLELSLQGFQYKNQLLLDQAARKTELENTYYGRYMDVLNQINTENAMAEEIRQFNKNYEFQVQQFAEQRKQFQMEYNENVRQFNEEIKRLKAKDAQEHAAEIQRLELQKQQLAEEKRQFDAAMEAQAAELEAQKEQLKIKGGGGGGSSSGAGGGEIITGGGTQENYAVNTAYYQGDLNSDAKKYGAFSNGYQPKGISGHGTLSKSGQTIEISTQTLSGQKQILVQNVWKAQDGTLWYWEGRQNKYIRIGTSGGGGGSFSKGGAGMHSPSMKAVHAFK